MSFRTDDTFIKHLDKLIKLQGHITLEQLDERLEFITHERYIDFLSCLDTDSIIKLTPYYLAEVKHGDVGNFSRIVPTLLKRLEQQQTEIDSLQKLFTIFAKEHIRLKELLPDQQLTNEDSS